MGAIRATIERLLRSVKVCIRRLLQACITCHGEHCEVKFFQTVESILKLILLINLHKFGMPYIHTNS